MQIIKTVKDFISFRNTLQDNVKLGFVPTMGALHKGHLSLLEKSKQENDISIVSIFVNPRQFNNKNDFEKYPITIDNDIKLLESYACDILFLPNNEDLYSAYEGYKIDFGGLDKMYEGEYRPGHFQGVVDVVYRLFDILKPTNSYFGEKDYQQYVIISLMVEQANMNINVVACEIIREDSGLAASSRNQRLSKDQIEESAIIYKALKAVKNNISTIDDPDRLSNLISSEIDRNPKFKTEYVVFCNSKDLSKIEIFEENTNVRLCIAVWCGDIRLIDNIEIKF